MTKPSQPDEVRIDLLNEDERGEYDRLIEDLKRADAGPTRWRYKADPWVGLVWGPLVTIPLIVWFFTSTPGAPFAPLDSVTRNALLVVSIGSLVLGPPVIIIFVMRARHTWVREHVTAAHDAVNEFLARIEYDARARAATRRSSYDDPYDGRWTKQRQHAWYGDHSELNWRDREFGERWGLSADEVSQWNDSYDPD